jgi:hypothetical protein
VAGLPTEPLHRPVISSFALRPSYFIAMPLEAKPLFRPDVLRGHLSGFTLPPRVESLRPKLANWAELIGSNRIDALNEQQILPDFLNDFFLGLLGYTVILAMSVGRAAAGRSMNIYADTRGEAC